MVPHKETAEERLLRMIEGPAGVPGQPRPVPVEEVPRKGSPWLQDLLDRAQDGFRQWGFLFRRRREQSDPLLRNLWLAGRVLWVVLAGLGAYVAADLLIFQPGDRMARISSGPSAPVAAEPAPVTAAAPLRSLGDYLAGVLQRDPFTGLAPLSAARTPAPTARHRLEEIAKGLVVVGIDRGPNPVALVEDTQAERTSVFKAGDSIHGATVKEITQEGVLLSYEGQEYLLR